MKLKRFLSIAACMLLMTGTNNLIAKPRPAVSTTAENSVPNMNEPFIATENGFSFGSSWGDITISNSYFLQGAEEVHLNVKKAQNVTFRCNGDIVKHYQLYNGEALDVTYVVTGDELEAARNGKFSATASTIDAILTITNLDAEGIEDLNNGNGGTALYPQLTDVPTVYIEFETNGMSLDNLLKKDRQTNEAPYISATIRVVDNSDPTSAQHLESFVDDVQIKVRGNSTSEISKRPYRLKFAKDLKDEADGSVIVQHKHDLLGLGYKKRNWTMLALALDPSLMRNALTYHIGKYVGMPFCPGYKFVDLVINGDYRGTYQISDHCEVGSNRVDVDEDTGWFLEASRGDMTEEPKIMTKAGLSVAIKNPESDNPAIITQFKTDIKNYFDVFEPLIKNSDPETGWRAYLDEETLVNYYIGANITGDYDGFMQLKMYREAQNDKLHFGPLWDKDLAFGNFAADDGKTIMQDYNNGQFYNHLKDLWKDARFVKKVHDRYHELLSNGLASKLASDIANIKTIVTQTQVKNQTRWGEPSSWILRFSNYNDAVDQLSGYVSNHLTFLESAIDDQYDELNCSAIPDDDPVPAPHQQLTNLPTIYLTGTVGNEWKPASLEVFDSGNKLYQGTEWTTEAVEVQYQGSGDKNKDSYRLKFADKTKLLSSGKFKQWVLLANDDDPSLMRNALAKELGDALGLPFTPGYQFVDLYVNDTYMGTYQVTDRVKAETGRALVSGGNKDLDWHVRLNDETEYNEDEPKYYIAGTEAMPYIIPKNPDPKDDNATTWNSSLKDEMTTYFESLFAKDQSGHFTAFADGVDKQQLIRWYIAQEVLCVYKGFSSIEAYRSVTSTSDQKLHLGVIWDSEKSLGNTGLAPAINMEDKETKDSYIGLMTKYAAYDVMKSIFTDLWREPWFANGVNNLWSETHESLLTLLNDKANALAIELAESQAKDAAKWSNNNEYAQAVGSITSWLNSRFAYLTVKFDALAAALPCTMHNFTTDAYAKMDDGTYRRTCSNCGTAETEGDAAYYHFIVYAEAKTKTETYTTDREWFSKQDVSEKPNTLFVTEAEGIKGRNVVSAGYCEELVIKDGHPFYYKEGDNFYAAKATYSRTINASTSWGTVCLPFKLADNDDVKLYALAEVDVDSQEGTMTFKSAEKRGALTPLAFRKLKSGATEVTFTGEAQANGYVTVKQTQGMSDNYSKEIVEGWNFYGNIYEPKEKDASNDPNMYYISGDKFWHATGTLTINPFRAYFSGTSTIAASRFRINADDAEGIEQVVEPNAPSTVYNLNGRQIRLEESESLKPGIYVVNGEKLLIE